ncbi:MAG: DUF5688 family protein [Lachnospiraceae bacterium]|nr:DUF5688 family protein [Lachnospiraceae bacterium]
MAKISFEEFKTYVQQNIKFFLPDEYSEAEVKINDVTKINGIQLSGLNVRKPGQMITANVYLEDFYDKLDEKDLVEVMKDIAEIEVRSTVNVPEFKIAEEFANFDAVKDKIVFRVYNAEKNKDIIDNCPHVMKDDLILSYCVVVDVAKDGIGSIRITNDHMRHWGVTPEELERHALKNTNRITPTTIQPMAEMLREMLTADGMPEEMIEAMIPQVPDGEPEMIIVSNESKVNGAVNVFLPETIDKVLEKTNGKDFYILPSSVHEVICISGDFSPSELEDMVHEVNRTVLEDAEYLSDSVYECDAATREIKKVKVEEAKVFDVTYADALDLALIENDMTFRK